MLRRLPLIALGSAIALAACTQPPITIASRPQLPSQHRIQQQENEGASDASLDAIIRDLDAGGDEEEPMATPSATPAPMQPQDFRAQQQYGGGGGQYGGGGSGNYGWYGGYGYGPYGYGMYARCQRIYRRCLNRGYQYYSGPNIYQFCRRVRNRCVSAQWWR